MLVVFPSTTSDVFVTVTIASKRRSSRSSTARRREYSPQMARPAAFCRRLGRSPSRVTADSQELEIKRIVLSSKSEAGQLASGATAQTDAAVAIRERA